MKHARVTIVNVAMRLFAEKGYAGCSVREICQAAGVTKPVLYYHFHSKEHLFQELMLDMFSHTSKNLAQLKKSGGEIRDRLAVFVASEFSDSRKDPNSLRLLFRMMFSPEEGYPHFNFVKEFTRERKVVADCIRHCQDLADRKRDPELMSTALMGMMLIEILEFLFTGRRTLTRPKAQKLIDLLLPVQ